MFPVDFPWKDWRLAQDLPLRHLQRLPRLRLKVLPQPFLANLQVPGASELRETESTMIHHPPIFTFMGDINP